MNVALIKKAIRRVIHAHRFAFKVIGNSQTKLLELGAITGIAEHYRSHGCITKVVNPKGRRSFVVKTSTRGFPWNFSRIEIDRDGILCELHMNLVVKGAHDAGRYCVDVGITNPNAVPTKKLNGVDWLALENNQLISFAEVKKLVIYPMLLAQFLGIVHEIKPSFLSGRGALDTAHPSPTLIVLGHYSANSTDIVANYKTRGISVVIAANYDARLARVRGGTVTSPIDEDESSL